MNYKKKDIDDLYTEILMDYILCNGYKVYSEAMCGSQGEIANIALSRNGEIICIYMKSFHDYDNYIDGIYIIVGRNKSFNAYEKNRDVVWLNELEEVTKYKLYEVAGRATYYTNDFNFAKESYNKNLKRLKIKLLDNSDRKTFNSERFKNFAYKKCKQTKGYKNVKKKDILYIEKRNGNYFAKIEGKNFSLKLNK